MLACIHGSLQAILQSDQTVGFLCGQTNNNFRLGFLFLFFFFFFFLSSTTLGRLLRVQLLLQVVDYCLQAIHLHLQFFLFLFGLSQLIFQLTDLIGGIMHAIKVLRELSQVLVWASVWEKQTENWVRSFHIG